MINAYGHDVTNITHAYSSEIGSIVGVKIDGVGIVAATVMTPEVGQDDNLVTVCLNNDEWMTVRYMDTYRADFINASVS